MIKRKGRGHMKKHIWIIGVMILLGIGITILISKDINKDIDSNQMISKDKEEQEQEAVLYTLEVDGEDILFETNENLYGLFFEDINKAADGGLNSELIENRSFEQKRGTPEGMFGWQVYKPDEESGYKIATESPLHINNPSYLQLNLVEDAIMLKNSGHNGVPIRDSEIYDFSIWIKNNDYKGNVVAYVEDTRGDMLTDQVQVQVSKENEEWTKYEAQLKGAVRGVGSFVLEVKGRGKCDIDFVSFRPHTIWQGEEPSKWKYGGLRVDLVEALKDIEPGFIRFPGGCVAEGEGLENLYNWKDTIGPLEERKEQKNTWGYWQSYGLGYHEYFQLCEDLGAVPIPVVHAGITCQIRRPGEHFTAGSVEFKQAVQDALDLIEYVNGDVDTYWGSKRVLNGHPEPFNLKYIAIGNENWGTQYFENFQAFKVKIEEKYPDMMIITSSGPWASGQEFASAWQVINKKYTEMIVDEHYYMEPEWFLSNVDRYDYYDRSGAKVFLGEYAAHNGKVQNQVPASGNSLYAAIAEAAFMTGLEKNADIVQLASYAPLLAKQGDTQWFYNMIWFDHYNVVHTPSYYVQQLFSQNIGNQVINTKLEKADDPKVLDGGISLGSWSTAVEYEYVRVINNKDGSIIFEDDFEDGEIDFIWQIKNGTWKEEDGVLKQTSTSSGEKMIYIDNVEWQDYTLQVEAKKTSGSEGFLVGVGVNSPEDYIWYNMGGWGNTSDAIERSRNGVKSTIGFMKPDSFEPIKHNQVYTVEMKYSEGDFRVYKNDKIVQEMTIKPEQKDVYTSVTKNSESGQIFIKVVNATNEPIELNLSSNNMNTVGQHKMITISHEQRNAVNSFKNKEMIKPVEALAFIEKDKPLNIAANSVNVIIIDGAK